MVHLNADERRGGLGAVPAVDPELQHAEHEAGHEAGPQARHGVHGLDWQLAEEGQHEVLQQVVLENADRCWLLARLQGPTPKLVLHGGSNLQLYHAVSGTGYLEEVGDKRERSTWFVCKCKFESGLLRADSLAMQLNWCLGRVTLTCCYTATIPQWRTFASGGGQLWN